MGELALGESFHMLSEEENRWVPDLLEEGMGDIGKLMPIPWATPLIMRLFPFLAKGPRKFQDFVTRQAEKRAAVSCASELGYMMLIRM